MAMMVEAFQGEIGSIFSLKLKRVVTFLKAFNVGFCQNQVLNLCLQVMSW